MANQEPMLRSVQVLKQKAEDLGLEGQDIAQYVKQYQALDREEKTAWRDVQNIQAEVEEKKKEDEIQIANNEATLDSAPRNRDAKSPKLLAFMDRKDE